MLGVNENGKRKESEKKVKIGKGGRNMGKVNRSLKGKFLIRPHTCFEDQ
jgi:hypothetical protein